MLQWEFVHPCLHRGRVDLLAHIKRKVHTLGRLVSVGFCCVPRLRTTRAALARQLTPRVRARSICSAERTTWGGEEAGVDDSGMRRADSGRRRGFDQDERYAPFADEQVLRVGAVRRAGSRPIACASAAINLGLVVYAYHRAPCAIVTGKTNSYGASWLMRGRFTLSSS